MILGQLIVSYRENFHGKTCINSGPLFIILIIYLTVPKPTLGHYIDRVSLVYLMLIIMLDQKVTESFVIRLGPKVQLSTSVAFGLGIFESGVEGLTHYTYSNFGK